MLARLLVRRKGAELFPVQVPLLLFQERTWPENGMLLESLWEPPGPRPCWIINDIRNIEISLSILRNCVHLF